MIRLFLSPTRSGSGAFLRCFENNPAVTRVFHQPIKSGFRQDGVFDYTFFEFLDEHTDEILVAKETVGGFVVPETEFSPLPVSKFEAALGRWLPSREIIARIEPFVLLRDPLQTWGSIERLNDYSVGRSRYYSPFELFPPSYAAVATFAIESRKEGLPVWCVTQELLATEPGKVLRRVCDRWRIPWSDHMVEWDHEYGVRTWFSEETRFRMEHDPRFQKSKEGLQATKRWAYVASDVSFISSERREIIEATLRPLYNEVSDLAMRDVGDVQG